MDLWIHFLCFYYFLFIYYSTALLRYWYWLQSSHDNNKTYAAIFSPFWNEIIKSLREEDYISNRLVILGIHSQIIHCLFIISEQNEFADNGIYIRVSSWCITSGRWTYFRCQATLEVWNWFSGHFFFLAVRCCRLHFFASLDY